MEFYLTKTDTMTFKAAYDSDAKVVKTIPLGECIKAKFVKSRSVKHHQKFFALLQVTIDNMPESMPDQYHNMDLLLDEIKFQVGHFEIFQTLGGKPYYRTKSISFGKMDQVAFNEFYNQAIDVILKHFLKDITAEQLDKEVMGFL